MKKQFYLSRAILRVAQLFVALLVFLSFQKAFAYGWDECGGQKLTWISNSVTMNISTTSFPIGSVEDEQLQSAMSHWNAVQGSSFEFIVGRDADGYHFNGNGINEVYFAPDSDFDPGVLATTYSSWSCNYNMRVEADVQFNAGINWSLITSDDPNEILNATVFESVALHELGHVLGLNHENRILAIMNAYYPGATTGNTNWAPIPDDRGGIRYLYPNGEQEVNIALSNFKKLYGGQSTVTMSPFVTNLKAGESLLVEFNLLNMGTLNETADVSYFLSSDDTISASDNLIHENSYAISAEDYDVINKLVTIPSDIRLMPGTYYVGIILDKDDVIEESDESDNILKLPFKITLLESDVDYDGVPNHIDLFPTDPTESSDFDVDGIGDNKDDDDDNDGYPDSADALPYDSTEHLDTDNDKIGNNKDTDDDNDGFEDIYDEFPLDPLEHVDTDGDKIGNYADLDDDGDGYLDINDDLPLDPEEHLDTDNDGIGDNADNDDDNDGVEDSDDFFPLDKNRHKKPVQAASSDTETGLGAIGLEFLFLLLLITLFRRYRW